MKITGFKLICNISIDFGVECALLGVTDKGHIYVEAYDEDAVQTYHLNANCELDASGEVEITAHLITPTIPTDHVLNHGGGRLRGLREDDRTSAWVIPIPIIEKMLLMPKLGLSIPPMLLLGLAESHVLSEAKLSDTLSFVCRRLRFAYALPQPQMDDDGLPYDYDTLEKIVAHMYDSQADELPGIVEAFNDIDGISLHRPMDCLVHNNRLIIADSGDGVQNNRLLIFELLQERD